MAYCIFQVGGVTSNQMNVYEEFAKSIPGFLPPEATGAPEPFPKPLQEQIPGLFGGSGQEGAVCIDIYSENQLFRARMKSPKMHCKCSTRMLSQ